MKKASRKLYVVNLDKAALASTFAELPGVSGSGEPIEIVGWVTWEKVLMRARATYPDGLNVEIFLTKPKNGQQSLSSWKLTYKRTFRAGAPA